MSKLIHSVFFILFTFALSIPGHAQNKKNLEKKREEINKKIAQTSELIEKTKSEQKSKQNQLVAIGSQIKLREELINNIGSELGQLNNSIVGRTQSISQKRQELDVLKGEYERMIKYAQRNRSSYQRMMFVFSSYDFNQAIRRVKYLKQYTSYRREQARKIEDIQLKLSTEVRNLNDQKLQKSTLLSIKEQEKQRLASDRKQEEKTLEQLKGQEKTLRSDLQKQQRERAKVDKELERLISLEIKKSKTANKGTFTLAPAAKELSANFEANKGRLPWPVDKGFISGRFGKQPHPVIRNIIIENNGLDITTDKEADIKAIFNGSVSSILIIPGAGKVVVLDHGAYRSIYTQLQDVYVTKGQKIKTNDKLGKCLPNEAGNRSEAHIEIWKIGQDGSEKLNPALWLTK